MWFHVTLVMQTRLQTIDENAELQSLITELMPESESCIPQEYISRDCELETCSDLSDDKWNETFMLRLGQQDTADVLMYQ